MNLNSSGQVSLQLGEEDRRPGQKFPTPSPGAGTRVFYETMLTQQPESFIALKWCTEHGVYPTLAPEEAVKELERRTAKRKAATARSSVKRPSSSSSGKERKLKKRKTGAVDVGLSVGTWEGASSISGL